MTSAEVKEPDLFDEYGRNRTYRWIVLSDDKNSFRWYLNLNVNDLLKFYTLILNP